MGVFLFRRERAGKNLQMAGQGHTITHAVGTIVTVLQKAAMLWRNNS